MIKHQHRKVNDAIFRLNMDNTKEAEEQKSGNNQVKPEERQSSIVYS